MKIQLSLSIGQSKITKRYCCDQYGKTHEEVVILTLAEMLSTILKEAWHQFPELEPLAGVSPENVLALTVAKNGDGSTWATTDEDQMRDKALYDAAKVIERVYFNDKAAEAAGGD